MGGSSSRPKRQNKQVNLYKLMKAMPHYSEQNTINFSRNDLADTLSDRSIVEAIQNGGGLKNMPKRDRYSEFGTQKIKNKNQNIIGDFLEGGNTNGYLIGSNNNSINHVFQNALRHSHEYNMEGGNQYSSISESELNTFKNLVNQTGGCSNCGAANHQSGGCGCGENTVLQGGGCGDSNHQTGGCGCGDNKVLQGGAIDNYSATNRLINIAQMGGANSTSDLINSLTSGSIASSTLSVSSLPSQSSVSSNQVVNYANLIGGNWNSYGGKVNKSSSSSSKSSRSGSSSSSSKSGSSSTSTASSATLSRQGSKSKGRRHASRSDDIDKSSSSIKSPKEDKIAELSISIGGASSVQNRLNKLSTATKSHHKRSKRHSSTSSEGSSPSSTVTSSSDSSKKHGSSSSSHTSSSSLSNVVYSGTNTVSVGNNRVYLSTTMSEGNVINAKQFYSTENGELYSSDTNYLRNNLSKRRFK